MRAAHAFFVIVVVVAFVVVDTVVVAVVIVIYLISCIVANDGSRRCSRRRRSLAIVFLAVFVVLVVTVVAGDVAVGVLFQGLRPTFPKALRPCKATKHAGVSQQRGSKELCVGGISTRYFFIVLLRHADILQFGR